MKHKLMYFELGIVVSDPLAIFLFRLIFTLTGSLLRLFVLFCFKTEALCNVLSFILKDMDIIFWEMWKSYTNSSFVCMPKKPAIIL